MLRTAAALRWRRPRLTADLAQQVAQVAAAAGDARLWLQAAGWYLHGRAATEDAREPAVEILRSLGSWPGAAELDGPDAARLRVELAAIAQGNGEVDEARLLVGGDERPGAADTPDELRLDRLAVLVRCGLVAPGPDLADLQRSVARIGRRLHAEPAAFADLLVGSVQRSGGDRAAAAASALRGLAHLGWTPDLPEVEPTSPHLAAALCSQWITALLDGAPAAELAVAVEAVGGRPERADSGRQGVLLGLTLARARPDTPARTATALRDLADRAGSVDTPALEAACRATEAELHEAVGDYRDALAALRAGIVAERLDRDRGHRFRAALARDGVDRRAAGPGRAAPAGADGQVPSGTAARPRRALPGGTAPDELDGPARPRPGGPASPHGRSTPGVPSNGRAGAGAVRTGDGNGQVDAGPGGSPASGNGTSAVVEADPPGGHMLEWVERSWYGPGPLGRPDGAGDAPLADALVEELRTAASSGAADGGSVPAPARDAADGETDAEGAGPGGDVLDVDGPGLPAGAAGAVEASGAGPVGDRGLTTPDPDAVRHEPWAALLPRSASAFTAEPDPGAAANGHDGPGRARTDTGVVPEPDGSTAGAGAVEHDDTAEADGPVVGAGHHVVVLDLMLDDAVLRHPAVPTVLREVAERAGRLVPPRGEIRPLPVDQERAVGDAGPERVEVVLPDADRVTALLWAQSLVGYVAGRVGRNGLPHEAALRSRVHGTSGPIADGVLCALTGPDLPDAADPGSAPGPGRGRHGGRVAWAGAATVRPGSGGRRRRDPEIPSDPDPLGTPDTADPTGEPPLPAADPPGVPGVADPVDGQARAADPLGGPDSVVGPPAVAEHTAGPDEDRARRVARDSARRRRRAPQGADRSEAGQATARSGDSTVIPDDLGLGDLLAGALAAYRDI